MSLRINFIGKSNVFFMYDTSFFMIMLSITYLRVLYVYLDGRTLKKYTFLRSVDHSQNIASGSRTRA